jgi:glutaredoxin 3
MGRLRSQHGRPFVRALSAAQGPLTQPSTGGTTSTGASSWIPRAPCRGRAQAYADRPYTRELALGEAQLDLRSFDLQVLEAYRNDPRYTCPDVDSSICISTEGSEGVHAVTRVGLRKPLNCDHAAQLRRLLQIRLPQCDIVKSLLKVKNIAFDEFRIDEEDQRQALYEKCGPSVRLMPQVFINDQRVGGVAELQAAFAQLNL